jgi:hypothetical protein
VAVNAFGMTTFVEFRWVLTTCFDLTRDQVAQAFDALVHARESCLSARNRVKEAQSGLEFGSV